MKSTLKLRYAIIVCILLSCFSFFPSSIYAQSASCNANEYCSWSLWSTTSISIPITINGTTCTTTFTYDVRQCGAKFQIKVIGFTHPDPLTCAWSQYLQDLDALNDWSTYWQIIDQINLQAAKKIGEVLFLNYRMSNPPASQFNCSNAVGCLSQIGSVEVVTFYSQCYEYIDIWGGFGVINPDCPRMTFFEECSSEQCCILSRKMCYDVNTNTVRVCETMTAGGGTAQCSGNSSFTPPTGCVIKARTGCIARECQ